MAKHDKIRRAERGHIGSDAPSLRDATLRPLATSDRLRGLANSLAAVARELDAMVAPSNDSAPERSERGQATAKRRVLTQDDKSMLAKHIYDLRRQRSAVFGDAELFGEPAWDILLDLYIAAIDRKSISVSSACIGSGAAPTTGLRWLGVLAQKGLVERSHDPSDQRRVLVTLTPRGLTAMDQFFDQAGDRLPR